MNLGKPEEIIQADPAPSPIPLPFEIETDGDRLPEHDPSPVVAPTPEKVGAPS
jgi:hypothetical protein